MKSLMEGLQVNKSITSLDFSSQYFFALNSIIPPLLSFDRKLLAEM